MARERQLTARQAFKMRYLYAYAGLTVKQCGKRFGMTKSAALHVIRGRTYKDVAFPKRVAPIVGPGPLGRTFTPQQVRRIRNSPLSGGKLAKSLNVHPTTIYGIRAYRTYKEVE